MAVGHEMLQPAILQVPRTMCLFWGVLFSFISNGSKCFPAFPADWFSFFFLLDQIHEVEMPRKVAPKSCTFFFSPPPKRILPWRPSCKTSTFYQASAYLIGSDQSHQTSFLPPSLPLTFLNLCYVVNLCHAGFPDCKAQKNRVSLSSYCNFW